MYLALNSMYYNI